jgi:uncharacterized protein YndB with AHSA1/START domain
MTNKNLVVIKRTLPASAARVFAAWTDAELLKQWMGPGKVTVSEAEVDLSVGGAYRIVMNDEEGKTHVPSGHYEEIVPNEKLVFSWQWAGIEEVTRVTIELREIGDNKTELTLTHAGINEAEARAHHDEGWNGCLDKMPAIL